MKVTCNADELTKQLEELTTDVEQRLARMVRKFSVGVAEAAIGYTPLGDADQYPALYAMREQVWGLNPEEGYARGSWQIALDGTLEKQALYGASSGNTALGAVNTHLMNYKLGEDIIVGNPAHYIGNLEGLDGVPSSKKAPQGIMKPTTEKVMAFYQLKLDDYYNSDNDWSTTSWQ
jgi:hypothetical protein